MQHDQNVDPFQRDAELLKVRFDDFASKHGLDGAAKSKALRMLRTMAGSLGDGRAIFLLAKPEVRNVLAECFGPGQAQCRALESDGRCRRYTPIE